MPIALAAGAASLVTVQHILPGDRFQLGGIGLSSLLGELVSCVIWSFVIFVWMILVNETQARRVLRVIFIVTIAILLGCSLMEIISKSFWQKSFFLPLISIAEDMGTTLVLATGVSKHWARRSRGVIEA
jgi:hypothetical protein